MQIMAGECHSVTSVTLLGVATLWPQSETEKQTLSYLYIGGNKTKQANNIVLFCKLKVLKMFPGQPLICIRQNAPFI